MDSGQPPRVVNSERELLVEVVTLLTQSQAELERRIAALESRLAGVERSVGTDAEERLVQLRGQVERLSAHAQPSTVEEVAAAQAPMPASPQAPTSAAPPAQQPRPSLEKRLASALTQDRASLVFIGAGVIALLYAAVTQIRP